MGLTTDQLHNKTILYRHNTIGGGTYYVDGTPLCLHPQHGNGKLEEHCTKAAGYATNHAGTGRCKYHGGALGIVAMSTGRYAPILGKQLSEIYQRFEQDPDLMDLTPELVLLRSILAKALYMYEDADDDEQGLKLLVHLIEKVSQQVERIERIAANHTLTVTNAKYLAIVALDVAKQFIPQDEMPLFVEAWRERVVNPVSIKMVEGEVEC